MVSFKTHHVQPTVCDHPPEAILEGDEPLAPSNSYNRSGTPFLAKNPLKALCVTSIFFTSP